MINGANHILTSGGENNLMPRFGYRRPMRRRRPSGNVVIHVPSSMAGTIATGANALLVIQSPSIDAGGSASSNIEAQDKDRTINVGHHMGQTTIDFTCRITTADGALEFCVVHVERHDGVPTLSHPLPTSSEISTEGMQQACRLASPGRVVHFSIRPYSADNTFVHRIKFRPSKFKSSKVKAGDYWMLIIHNRGSATITYDFQCRYKEYE